VSDGPADKARYDLAEERAIMDAHARGEPVSCPRCQVPMTSRPLGGGSFGLGYARRRQWLLCPQCRRSVLFDQARGTRN
jgi:transposase-like protein